MIITNNVKFKSFKAFNVLCYLLKSDSSEKKKLFFPFLQSNVKKRKSEYTASNEKLSFVRKVLFLDPGNVLIIIQLDHMFDLGDFLQLCFIL